jgi:hypothetical protein
MVPKIGKNKEIACFKQGCGLDSHIRLLPSTKKYHNFAIHLVKIDTDPDPTKLCIKERIKIHNTDLYDDENKSLPLTVELLEGVIHGTPVSELHQP